MCDVAVVKYEKPYESLARAVDTVGGLGDISTSSKVVIKPNIGVWFEGVDFPKYGVLTTARMIEDTVILLKEHGVGDIAIVEGVTEAEKDSVSLLGLAAERMGLNVLSDRYGARVVDVHKGGFTKVGVGDVLLSVNDDILEADYVINLPVLKTHAVTKVSLGIKNLKGVLNMASRKKCHSADRISDLDYHISRLPEIIRPYLTIIDGIYTLERGAYPSGEAHRSDIIIASKDLVSADVIGAKILGIAPHTVPHIAYVASNNKYSYETIDKNLWSDFDFGKSLTPHHWEIDMASYLEQFGIDGIDFPLPDDTACTYCAYFIEFVLYGLVLARLQGESLDNIEILTGKIMEPSGLREQTLLVGQCQVRKNGGSPLLKHGIEIRGCPPSKKGLMEAFRKLGFQVSGSLLEWRKAIMDFHFSRYIGRPEFDDSFYRIH
jgi:uncharacterized protein (DUF362 family)